MVRLIAKLLICFVIALLVGLLFARTTSADIGGPPLETPQATVAPTITPVPVTPAPTVIVTPEPTESPIAASPTPSVAPQETASPSLNPEERDIKLDKIIQQAIADNKAAIEANNVLINGLIFLITLATLTLLALIISVRRLRRDISEWTDFNTWE